MHLKNSIKKVRDKLLLYFIKISAIRITSSHLSCFSCGWRHQLAVPGTGL